MYLQNGKLHVSIEDMCDRISDTIEYYRGQGVEVLRIVVDRAPGSKIDGVLVELARGNTLEEFQRMMDSELCRDTVTPNNFEQRLRCLEELEVERQAHYIKKVSAGTLMSTVDLMKIEDRLFALEESLKSVAKKDDFTRSYRYLRELMELKNAMVEKLGDRVTHLERNVKWARKC